MHQYVRTKTESSSLMFFSITRSKVPNLTINFPIVNNHINSRYEIGFSEIKTILNDIKIIGELAIADGETTGCFIFDLSSLDCRKGCDLCPIIEKSEKLFNGFNNREEGPGRFRDVFYKCRIYMI